MSEYQLLSDRELEEECRKCCKELVKVSARRRELLFTLLCSKEIYAGGAATAAFSYMAVPSLVLAVTSACIKSGTLWLAHAFRSLPEDEQLRIRQEELQAQLAEIKQYIHANVDYILSDVLSDYEQNTRSNF